MALKPTSSLTNPGQSIDRFGNPVEVVTKGRHDPCVGIRATPIAEAMVALVLMDHLLRHRGQIGREAGLQSPQSGVICNTAKKAFALFDSVRLA